MSEIPWKMKCPVCNEFFQPTHAGQKRCTDPICRKRANVPEIEDEMSIKVLRGEDIA